LDTDKHGDQFLMPILGDQLTVQRLWSLNCCKSFDGVKAGHILQWVMPISGRSLAGCMRRRMVYWNRCARKDFSPALGSVQDSIRRSWRIGWLSNPLLRKRLGGILGRTKVFSATGHMDFYPVDTQLTLVIDAVINVAILAHIKFGWVYMM
jgi:hypothetical protein